MSKSPLPEPQYQMGESYSASQMHEYAAAVSEHVQEYAKELEQALKSMAVLIKNEQDLRAAFNRELLSCFCYTQQPDNPAREVLRLVSNLTTLATPQQLETARNSTLL